MLTNEKLERSVIAFDVNEVRLEELRAGYDRTNEVNKEILGNLNSLHFTSDPSDLHLADVFIITVPTPVDSSKTPDLSSLKSATKIVASAIKSRSLHKIDDDSLLSLPIVIYESTVYPGTTEEVCVPILESKGLVFNKDFFCGYSPERINPGDQTHKLTSIIKVTSGSTTSSSIGLILFTAQ